MRKHLPILCCLSIASFFLISGCTPTKRTHQTVTPSTATIPIKTPELLFTATPDPMLTTVSVEISNEYSQEEIAKILYSKWLEQFLSENIDPELRLDAYEINKIDIPFDQKCAKRSGGEFVAEVVATLKTTLPLISTTNYVHSDWIAGGGTASDEFHITKQYGGIIFKSGNLYTLTVIIQIPMCD